jgi:putative tryptophan/tyrosine transport system substrate-binding protein
MRRREFIATLAGAAAAWPLAAHAQQTPPVIGFIGLTSFDEWKRYVEAFHQGLGEAGYVAGHNVTMEYRWAEGHYERLPAMAADLVERNVKVIVPIAPPATLAVKAATQHIPVVFFMGSDPVKLGLVASLNRPGGNMTGVSLFTATLEAKRLGLLAELVPAARSFGVLINQANDNAEMQLKDVAQGGVLLGRPISIQKASNAQEIEAAFATFSQQQINALLVASDPYFFGEREKILALAARYKLPAIYEWREFAEAGGLASYGTNLFDNYRMAGQYVGRVLKGEKPATLPVFQATKFEFVINLKTAKTLGLEVSPTVSARADDIIE